MGSKKKPFIKLEAGKRYFRRDGGITEPLEDRGDGWLKDMKHGYNYPPKSKGLTLGSQNNHKGDLVAPYDCPVKAFNRLMEDLPASSFNAPGASRLLEEVIKELRGAEASFPPFNSLHEAYSVLHEETEELWEEVKKKQLIKGSNGVKVINFSRTKAARKEAIQVVAMALRLILDCCESTGKSYGK